MAKGNMFLGMARGKIGDVVFYRADGQQLSRVRNRNPRNPRSDPQLFQRAIMATVVQAYTAGRAIFDHSFQGYSVGAQNQREFLKRNAKMLRELIATDINTPIATNQQKARVVAPGVSMPVPNAYVISRGTYDQTLFSFNTDMYKLPAPTSNEKVNEYASRNNLVAGDIYTLVMFAARNDIAFASPLWDDVLASQNACDFGFIRFIVKDVSGASEVLSSYSQLFEIESVGNNILIPEYVGQTMIGDGLTIGSMFSHNTAYTETGAIGMIRSRLDQDLRSNSEMNMIYGDSAETMFGIASDYLLDAWKAGTSSIGNSNLILEGGEG